MELIGPQYKFHFRRFYKIIKIELMNRELGLWSQVLFFLVVTLENPTVRQ